MASTTTRAEASSPRGRTSLPTTAALEDMVGAHPEALRSLFARGVAADPFELGDAPRGRLLALEPLATVHLAVRPVVRALARTSLWSGIGFDHGGNAGFNRILGGQLMRFRTAVEPGELDGRPALVLSYERAAWPVSALRDELRAVGPGVALGAFFLRAGARRHLLGWFGLEASRQP